MKIVIFGVGRFYQERKAWIPADIEVAAFLDNNSKLQGQYIENRIIVSPCEVSRLSYDKIVLMSVSEESMKSQLIELGVKEESIWYWERLVSEAYHGTFKLHCAVRNPIKGYKKKILIISTALDYNGGTIAAVYAAKALQERGNNVLLAAPRGNKDFINEITEGGINLALCPALPYLHKEEIFLIDQFDAVLVNVFQMLLCAYEISKIKPVMWWIHEPEGLYKRTLTRFQKYINQNEKSTIDIYAVSNIAKRNFNLYFPDRIKETFSYGIPDENDGKILKGKTEELIFAIVGNVCPRKAQDVFVKAARLLNAVEKGKVQFWIIGFAGTDEYSNQIREMAAEDETLKIKGLFTRQKMEEAYKSVNVLVCPSLEDPLPIVATESMMWGKPCIVSDGTGTEQYIEDGKNGFICRTGDTEDLCEKMRWIIHNQEKLPEIGRKAREIYEAHFSMESFGERLETALQDTMEHWCNQNQQSKNVYGEQHEKTGDLCNI